MGRIKDMMIRCHNERDEREAVVFIRTGDVYVPEKECTCISCEKKIESFRDQLSIREFIISGICQHCQDEVFGE
jgi:hypothetical protein